MISIKDRVKNIEQGIVQIMSVVNKIKIIVYDIQVIISILIKKNIITSDEINQERMYHAERFKIASEAAKQKNSGSEEGNVGREGNTVSASGIIESPVSQDESNRSIEDGNANQ